MTQVQDGRDHGHRHHGPRHGRGPGARGHSRCALYDTSTEALERAKAGYDLAWGVLDRLETPVVEGGSVRYASDVADALAGAEFVIEAIPENLELKQQVYAEYEQHVGPEVILASNTSGIPATKIAANLAHPERVVVMHWSNPPHLIPMIEVVPGEQTNQATIDGAIAVVERRRLLPLPAQEGGARASSRTAILYAIMRECLALVDEGVVGLRGAGPQRQVGHRLQARGHPADAAAGHGGHGHLHRGRQLPQPGPVQHGGGLARPSGRSSRRDAWA